MPEIVLRVTFVDSDGKVCFGPVSFSIDPEGKLLAGLQSVLQVLSGSRSPLPKNIFVRAYLDGFAVSLKGFSDVLLPDEDLVVHLSVPAVYFKSACFGAAKSALAYGVSKVALERGVKTVGDLVARCGVNVGKVGACSAKYLLGPVTLIGTTVLLDYTKDGKVSWKTLVKCACLTAVYVVVPVAGPLSLAASAGVEVLCELMFSPSPAPSSPSPAPSPCETRNPSVRVAG